MTPEERREMARLVETVQNEKNHAEFMKAVQRIMQLLGDKERRIDSSSDEFEGKK